MFFFSRQERFSSFRGSLFAQRIGRSARRTDRGATNVGGRRLDRATLRAYSLLFVEFRLGPRDALTDRVLNKDFSGVGRGIGVNVGGGVGCGARVEIEIEVEVEIGLGFIVGIETIAQVPEEGGIENVVVVGGCEESMRSVRRALWVLGAGCYGASRRQSQLQFVRNLAGNIFKTDRRARDAFETYAVQR